jgi:hypothetical protein
MREKKPAKTEKEYQRKQNNKQHTVPGVIFVLSPYEIFKSS